MRLTPAEHLEITRSIKSHDPQAAIYLFGSRVDDHARGGDIDLLVLSKTIDIWARLDILADLHEHLGERRIDLLVYPDLSKPFARVAMAEGVPL